MATLPAFVGDEQSLAITMSDYYQCSFLSTYDALCHKYQLNWKQVDFTLNTCVSYSTMKRIMNKKINQSCPCFEHTIAIALGMGLTFEDAMRLIRSCRYGNISLEYAAPYIALLAKYCARHYQDNRLRVLDANKELLDFLKADPTGNKMKRKPLTKEQP